MLGGSWYIRLLGGLIAERDRHPLVRFQTRKTGGLLAFLAYHMPHAYARDLLIEQFWPELDLDGGRNCLGASLSSLRRQLEPPDVAPGGVIVSTRLDVRLNSQAVRTDVQDLLALANGPLVEDGDDPARAAAAAISLYRGYLLPGSYEDWVAAERDRLSAIFVRLVAASVEALEQCGELDLALEHALAAAGAAPDHEPAHRDAIRLYRRLGRDLDAVRQYRTLEERMREEWGRAPSPATRALLDGIGSDRLAQRRLRHKARRQLATATPNVRAAQQPAQPSALTVIAPPASDLPPLPKPLTRFFGREDELSRLRGALLPPEDLSSTAPGREGARLITICGHAGAGKTRLALEAARVLATDFEDQTAFAPLTQIADSELVYDSILGSIGVRPSPGSSREQLLSALTNRRCLLVLDNAEHLEPSLARHVESLLDALPRLCLIVTSRVPLGIAGERLMPLAPLAIPEQPGTPERLLEFASVRMFVDRAQAVSPDFQITARNADAIVAVCEKLEGMPLAIELAAARVSALTPAQMLAELDRRFRFLVSRTRTVEDRHRTLEAALAWSYDLLPPTSQRFLSRVSLFRGGWTLEGARAIWADGNDDEDALDHLERLVDQALISAEEVGGAKRFRMLESVREFADLRLTEEDRSQGADRLAGYLVALAEREAPCLRGPRSSEAVAKLQPELANFRWLLTTRCEAAESLRLSAALWRLWSVSGRAEEGVQWLRKGLDAQPDAPAMLRLNSMIGLGSLLRYLRQSDEASLYAASALELAREIGDTAREADALNLIAVLADERGRSVEARNLLEQSLQLLRRLGDTWSIAAVLNNLGRIAQRTGNLAQARRFFEESQDLLKALNDWSTVAVVLLNIGVTADEMGDYTAARAAYEQSLMLCRELGNRRDIGVLLFNLGEAMFRECDHPDAPRYLCESMRVRMELGDRAGVALPLAALGSVAARRGDLTRACRLYAAADSIRSKSADPVSARGRQIYDEDLAAVRAELHPSDFRSAWEFGQSLSLEQAVAFADNVGFVSSQSITPLPASQVLSPV